ncbi:MAG: type II toxin-antitoxin system RelE/ParE family toxin [Deltaproteobacteria bacterium]|nr:type II toxin-antitoxin system RelE/ParE family toxin [Deltaproteobacteria bacterium]
MEIFYKPPFRRFVKKQTRPFQLLIEDEVEKVMTNPGIGKPKKGDLSEFQVHKFTFRKQEVLIAYRVIEADILFYMIGPHENFYRDFKKYLREVE